MSPFFKNSQCSKQRFPAKLPGKNELSKVDKIRHNFCSSPF